MLADDFRPGDIETADEFGMFLRRLRGRLTQEALARHSVLGHVALSRRRVSYIENGTLPTAEQLRCYLGGCGQPELFDELEAVRSGLACAALAGQAGETTTPAGDTLTAERSPRLLPKWQITAAAVVIVAVGLVVALVVRSPDPLGPANLASADGPVSGSGSPSCAQGFVCFWSESGFTGTKIQLDPDWATGSHCIRLPFAARSLVNNSRERQRGFANSDCTGTGTVLQHGGGVEPSVEVNAYKHS
ncbi:hypothetical protein SAMN04489729_6986 [Amycolatopsis lurida]|nr:peptidase inhibitor family I36 protein [Amycolatopsis lurida]SEE29563.1 hypothetical protein SAMN04489729_6986 [Amycolatopsis lurida]